MPLSFAGAGLCQELIKIFQVASLSADDPIAVAFLDGYDCDDRVRAIEDGKLMLAMDGLQMAWDWLQKGEHPGGVQSWLTTIIKIANGWR